MNFQLDLVLQINCSKQSNKAPRRPKSKSVTYGPTDERTDTLLSSRFVATKNSSKLSLVALDRTPSSDGRFWKVDLGGGESHAVVPNDSNHPTHRESAR